MKEDDIRPDALNKEHLNLIYEDIKSILRKKSQFVEIPCPACESENYIKIFKKHDFIFVKCNNCETIFVNPRPTFEILSDFYAVSKSWNFYNDFLFPSTEDSRRENIFKPRAKKVVELCKNHNTETKFLFDVGSGFGTFCEEITKLNIFDNVIAVELSHKLAETSRKKGLKVLEMPIEEVNMRNVNVITTFELIEHLFRPKDVLVSCNKILTRGGLLILTTPNIKGFDLLVLGKYSDNILAPIHINYFHADSLKILLENCGFEIIEVLTPGKLDAELVRKKTLSSEFDLSNNPFLEYILIEKWDVLHDSFQNFLSENNLSSHLWIVAKKINSIS